jgi:hypothetical protein
MEIRMAGGILSNSSIWPWNRAHVVHFWQSSSTMFSILLVLSLNVHVYTFFVLPECSPNWSGTLQMYFGNPGICALSDISWRDGICSNYWDDKFTLIQNGVMYTGFNSSILFVDQLQNYVLYFCRNDNCKLGAECYKYPLLMDKRKNCTCVGPLDVDICRAGYKCNRNSYPGLYAGYVRYGKMWDPAKNMEVSCCPFS